MASTTSTNVYNNVYASEQGSSAPLLPADDYLLFTPLTLGGDLTLANRIVHAPLTRARSGVEDHVPSELNAAYYEQRAAAGLIITEATAISEQAFGWYGAPALYTDAQQRGWTEVVRRVHARGGKMFLQLWHMGRQAHPSFNAKRETVSASATRYAEGRTRNSRGESTAYETPRALATDEIQEVVDDYRKCAARAKAVGFDGVEVHAAGGYLLDQFLQRSTNHSRTDRYGDQSLANRVRLTLEVVDAVCAVFPPHCVGVRLAPNRDFGGMGREDNSDVFLYAMRELGRRKLAYLALQDGEGDGVSTKTRFITSAEAKQAFGGVVMANFGYDRESAEAKLRSGEADCVGFGRWFMSNPDLVARFRSGAPLRPMLAYEFFYDASKGADGYTKLPSEDDESSAP